MSSIHNMMTTGAVGYTSTLPSDRPLMGKDVAQWRQTMNLSSADICWLLALPSSKWGVMIKQNQDQPIHHEMELLIRIWDANKHLIPLPEKVSVSRLKESLGLSSADIGLLLGREEVSGTRWVKNEEGDAHVGQAQTPLSQRLTLAVYQLSESNQRNHYFQVLKMVGMLRGIPDVLKSRTWKTSAERRISKIRRLVNSTAKILRSNPQMNAQDRGKYLRIQSCSTSWVENFDALNELNISINNASNDISRLSKLIEKKPLAKKGFEQASALLAELNEKKVNIENHINLYESQLEELLGPELDGKLVNSAKAVSQYKRFQKLTKLQPDSIVNRYAITLSTEWLEYDESITQLREKLNDNDNKAILAVREQIDQLTERKKVIETNLETVIGPKLDFKIYKSSSAARLTRQIHQLAKKQDIFSFTSNQKNNVFITEFIKSQAAKWLDLSAKFDELQPILFIINDKSSTMPAVLNLSPDEQEQIKTNVIEITESMNKIETKLQSLLGKHFDSVKFRSPELLAKIRQISLWKSNASKVDPLATPSMIKINQFILNQTQQWLKNLDTIDTIAPLNLIDDYPESATSKQQEADLWEKQEFIYDILNQIDKANVKVGSELRLYRKIERIRQNALSFSQLGSGEELTLEFRLNEQVFKLCSEWLNLQSKLDIVRPLAIINDTLTPNVLNDAADVIKSEFSATFSEILNIENKLKAILGNNLDGKHIKDEEYIKIHRKVSRFVSRATKENDIASKLGDHSSAELWAEVLLQSNAWLQTSEELDKNQRYQTIIFQSAQNDDSMKDELNLLKIEEQRLTSTLDNAFSLLSALLKDKLDSSYIEKDKIAGRFKRKLQTILEDGPANIVDAASVWINSKEQLRVVQDKLAIFDSKLSMNRDINSNEYAELCAKELGFIADIERNTEMLSNCTEIEFYPDTPKSKQFTHATKSLKDLVLIANTAFNSPTVIVENKLINSVSEFIASLNKLIAERKALTSKLSALTLTSELLTMRKANNALLRSKLDMIDTFNESTSKIDSELDLLAYNASKLKKQLKSKLSMIEPENNV